MVSVAATAILEIENLSAKRRRASLARLRTNDWNELTAAANASPNHVGNLDRWIAKARAENPALDDAQAARLGQMLKDDYYARLSAAGVRARRLRAEIDRIEGTPDAE